MVGRFVISLDFELLWGMRDRATRESYGRNVLGERDAIPALLDLFERSSIRATWATVGMLLCESKDEILARGPREQPRYANPALSAYSYLDEVGTDERSDPHYFGASIARHILSCPGQELATHTFSHYYCLEPGQTEDQFAADIDAALKVLNGFHQRCVSITFPRNQYSGHHLNICHRAGLRVFRGNETNPNYAPLDRRQAFDIRRRGYRLMDAYYDLSGQNVSKPEINPGRLVDVPSSRFLRPWNARLRFFEGSRLARIRNAMTAAATSEAVFHLWWHPHNFGVNLVENIGLLREILEHFRKLHSEYGMMSSAMAEWAPALALCFCARAIGFQPFLPIF